MGQQFDIKQQVMDNLKYSLKTQQFGKKRQHIFSKDYQKQSISLVVHEPIEPNIFVQQSKSSDSSQAILIMPQDNDNSQNANTFYPTCKKDKQSIKSSSQHSAIKKKYANHAINTCSKVKVPQDFPQSRDCVWQRKAENGAASQIQILRHIFMSNQERLTILTNSINSLYTNTIELYSNHEKKMQELVNVRCHQIANLFKVALASFKSKDQKMNQLNNHITLLLNTIKDTKESLRIIKIKQQCIQALQQKQAQNKITHKINLPYPNTQHSNSNFNQQTNSQFQLFKNQDEIRELSLKQKKGKQIAKGNNNQSFEIYIQNMPSQQIKQQYKKSPFQTHQMLAISQTMPMETRKIWEAKHMEYSFRKNYQNQQAIAWPSNNKQIEKAKKKANPNAANQFSLLKSKLRRIMKQFAKRQIWQDNLNCLRFNNGTYVLDQAGDALICTREEFKVLVEEKIVSQWRKF